MAMKQLSKAIGLAAMALSGAVLADTPTLSQVLDASGVSVGGYIDAAYTYYDIEQPTGINYFDDNENSFGVKQAGLTVSTLPEEGFGGLVNVTAGSDADYIHSYGGTDSSGFDLTQAYVQYATGPFIVMGGKFNTLAGAEVIAPTGNTNISRSIAFLWALPFTHTGVRLAYTPMDTLSLYAGVNNGWDQQKDLNTKKTIELGAIWSPASMITLAASIYSGKEVIANPITALDTDTNRFLFDTVLTIKPTDALSIVLNYDYGKQDDAILDNNGNEDDAEWSSLVGYINYQFNEQWRVSLRGEQYDDKDNWKIGYVDVLTGVPSEKITAFTATVGYAASANFELRGEVRMDNTEEDALIDDGDAEDSQTYFAIEALYKF
jgi:hypothetical protein